MTEYDRSFIVFWAGFVVNCCGNNWVAALGGFLATLFGGFGMWLHRNEQ